MSEIKKGALVKAWDDDSRKWIVGRLVRYLDRHQEYEIDVESYDNLMMENIIELPPELVKQLENLGK